MLKLNITLITSILLLLLMFSSFASVYAESSAYEILIVDGFTADSDEWDKVGDSPYLSYANDGDHIVISQVSSANDTWYTFENIDTLSKVFDNCSIRMYYDLSLMYDSTATQYVAVTVYIYVGNNYVDSITVSFQGTQSGDTGWLWTSWHTVAGVNSFDDVNNLRIQVIYETNASSSAYACVDCIQLRVGYTISKSWHLVETWHLTLQTKQAHLVESWHTILDLISFQQALLIGKGFLFLGILLICFSLFGVIKIHNSFSIFIFWIILFFIGIGLLIASGNVGVNI